MSRRRSRTATRAQRRARTRLRLIKLGAAGGALLALFVWDASGKTRGGGGDGEGWEGFGLGSRQLASALCTGTVSTGTVLLQGAGILYTFLGLAVVCDEFFQTSLEKISEVLELTPDVAGATFLAAGSSAPELFTSLADAFGDSSSVGMGTIVGSAMFNILVIVALSAAVAGKDGASLDIDWRPVCRDVLFYSFAILLLSLVFMDSKVELFEAIIMVVVYVCYIVVMKFNAKILARCQPIKIDPGDAGAVAAAAATVTKVEVAAAKPPEDKAASKVAPEPDPENNGGGEPSAGQERRKSMTLGVRHRVERRRSSMQAHAHHLAGVEEQDEGATQALVNADAVNAAAMAAAAAAASDAEAGGGGRGSSGGSWHKGGAGGRGGEGGQGGEREGGGEEESRFQWPETVPDQILYVLGLPFLVAFTATIPDCSQPRWDKFYVLSFVMSIMWIGLLTHYMVVWATTVSCYLGVSVIVMGLVVLSVGTSVPDAMGSMIAARGGEADMAIANAVGSNVFDVLLGLGLPWTLRSIYYGESTPVDKSGIFNNVIMLFCTVLVFVGCLILNNWKMNTKMGMGLFGLYIAYIIYVIVDAAVG